MSNRSTAQAELHRRTGMQTRGFRVAPSTVDEKSRSIEAVIATESPVRVMDFSSYELVDEVLLMSGLIAIPEQIPLLDSHDRGSVAKQLGSTRDIRVEGDELRARNYFAADQGALDAFGKVRDGHITDNSVGYSVQGYEMLRPGETRSIGGRAFTAGEERSLKVVTKWAVLENSITPIGADPRAKTRAQPMSSRNVDELIFTTMTGEPMSWRHESEPDRCDRDVSRAFGRDVSRAFGRDVSRAFGRDVSRAGDRDGSRAFGLDDDAFIRAITG